MLRVIRLIIIFNLIGTSLLLNCQTTHYYLLGSGISFLTSSDVKFTFEDDEVDLNLTSGPLLCFRGRYGLDYKVSESVTINGSLGMNIRGYRYRMFEWGRDETVFNVRYRRLEAAISIGVELSIFDVTKNNFNIEDLNLILELEHTFNLVDTTRYKGDLQGDELLDYDRNVYLPRLGGGFSFVFRNVNLIVSHHFDLRQYLDGIENHEEFIMSEWSLSAKKKFKN